ncbi:hypothetical protein M0804_011594 [Polistes exclamans]|nr:hypothetical protein M0804_011594 [Polistes exclamans]
MGMGTRSAHSLAYNRYTRKTGSRVARRVSNEYLVSDIPWDVPKMSEESSKITEKGQRSQQDPRALPTAGKITKLGTKLFVSPTCSDTFK